MEVILVDDASSDDSLTLAKAYPFTILHLKHQSGPATARNLGAKVAKGKYLLFIDADVIVQADTFSKILDYYEKHPEID